jgi:hypothetical protein
MGYQNRSFSTMPESGPGAAERGDVGFVGFTVGFFFEALN